MCDHLRVTADDNVRTLLEEDTLLAAVYGCITAATYEWDTVQQVCDPLCGPCLVV